MKTLHLASELVEIGLVSLFIALILNDLDSIYLLGDVEYVREVIIILTCIHQPEDRVAFLAYLLGFLKVRGLHPCGSELALCLRDNRNEQVEHENNEDEADQEEDHPVYVTHMRDLIINIEITETREEG